MLPYARSADAAKARVVYRRISTRAALLLGLQGLLPLGLYIFYNRELLDWQWLVFAPCLTMYFLYRLLSSRLRGYTGDCCGAMFLLTELTFYLAVAVAIAR